MKVSGVLRGAAEYIAEHGKLTGCFGDDGGPRCVTGAIWSVRKGDVNTHRHARYLLRCMGALTVPEWSDNSTADEVILGLLMAAEYAEDEEAGNG